MTRKHFKALAESLAYRKPSKVARPSGYKARYIKWADCIWAVAEVCKAFNPAFDQARFFKACDYIGD